MKIDTGSTAWMLASTALVLLMTPGLAFFYGGMTRARTTLNMMMMSWVAGNGARETSAQEGAESAAGTR